MIKLFTIIILISLITLITLLVIKKMINLTHNTAKDFGYKQKVFSIYSNLVNAADGFCEVEFVRSKRPEIIASIILVKYLKETSPNLDPRKKITRKLKGKFQQAEIALQKAYAKVFEVQSEVAMKYLSELSEKLKEKEFIFQTENYEHFNEIENYLDLIIEQSLTIAESESNEFEDSKMFSVENKTYYNILGVSSTASSDEITQAYRKLASLFHPDKFQTVGGEYRSKSEEFMKSLNEVYVTLKDDDKRKNYDLSNNI